VRRERTKTKETGADRALYRDLVTLAFFVRKNLGDVCSSFCRYYRNGTFSRAVAVLKTEGGSVVYLELSLSETAVPSESWEFGFRDGLIVSDGLKQVPLFVSGGPDGAAAQEGAPMDGTPDEIRAALENASAPLDSLLPEGGLEAFARKYPKMCKGRETA
jgi:hypothetical protein